MQNYEMTNEVSSKAPSTHATNLPTKIFLTLFFNYFFLICECKSLSLKITEK